MIFSTRPRRNSNGNMLRRLPRNQICIGVATDKKHTVCLVEGYGKPSRKSSYQTLKDHIAPGSKPTHDKEPTRRKLVEKLPLQSKSYASRNLNGLSDSENPLNLVDCIHSPAENVPQYP